MAADTGFSRRTGSERDLQPVAITSVDAASRTAYGTTRVRTFIKINCAYATGDTITVPAVGEQWYVERFEMEWRLYGRIPHNDDTLNIEPVEGQVSVGSTKGPLELNGAEIRVNGDLKLGDYYYRDDGTTLQRSADGQTWSSITASGGQSDSVVTAAADSATARIAGALTGHQSDPAQPAADVAALSTWGTGITQSVDAANASLSGLTGTLASQSSSLATLGGTVATQSSTISGLSTTVSSHSTSIGSLGTNLTTVGTNLSNLGNSLLHSAETVIGSISSVIMDGVNSVGDFLSGLVTSFLAGGTGTPGLTPVAQAHAAAGAVRGRADAAYSNAASAQTTADAASAAADAAAAAADAAAAQAYLASVGTETVSSFFNTPRVLPAWIGQQTDDVAFAYTLIDGTTAPTAGRLILIPITVQQDRVYDSVKIGLDGNAMTNLYVGVYEVNEITGAGTKVIDLGDVKSAVTLAYDQIEFPLASPVSVQKGEIYYIGVLQTGTSQPMFRWSAGSNFTIGIYPQSVGLYHSVAGLTALPSSFTGAQVVSGGTVMKYWGALGILTPSTAPPDPAKVTYTDSFDRADSSSLGASWLARTSPGLSIHSNTAAAYAAAGAGWPSGENSYIGRLTRTDQEVGGVLASIGGNYTSVLNSTRLWQLGLRASGSGNGPLLQVQQTYASGSGTPSHSASIMVNGVVKSSTAVTTATGSWKFTASGTSYTAWQWNGSSWISMTSWADTTGVWPVTSASTETFIYASSHWNGGAHGASINDWYSKDL